MIVPKSLQAKYKEKEADLKKKYVEEGLRNLRIKDPK